jgi:GntR family transcriptional regulator of arabinose operon
MKASPSHHLYDKVKNTIRADIASGKLRPGDRVTRERDLAESHDVSRITVKKAIADLVQEGTLERLPDRRGTFVRQRGALPGSPHFIAVAIDDVRKPFGAEMLRGIEDYLWGKRIHTLVCNADRDAAKVEEYFRSILTHDIHGVIFAPVICETYRQTNRRLAAILENAGVPFTLIDRSIPGLVANYVGANHEESSRTITRHLIDRGHRRILLARGLECTSMEERVEGYRHAHEEAGIPVDERLIVRADDTLLAKGSMDPHELKRLEKLVRQAGTYSCFYGLNDGLLRAGVSVLTSLGIQIGSAVQLASHNEIGLPPIPNASNMPHFVEPSYEMGWEAARILVEHLGDPNGAIVQKTLKSRFVPEG